MAFVWQDKENGVDDILAEHINDVAHEVIRLEEDKVNKDLSNVEDVVFKNKATSAGVAGKVSSVNGKTGAVELSAEDVGTYTKEEMDDFGDRVFKAFELIQQEYVTKDLSNVPNEYFLAKLNSVLPNGDEVSY